MDIEFVTDPQTLVRHVFRGFLKQIEVDATI